MSTRPITDQIKQNLVENQTETGGLMRSIVPNTSLLQTVILDVHKTIEIIFGIGNTSQTSETWDTCEALWVLWDPWDPKTCETWKRPMRHERHVLTERLERPLRLARSMRLERHVLTERLERILRLARSMRLERHVLAERLERPLRLVRHVRHVAVLILGVQWGVIWWHRSPAGSTDQREERESFDLTGVWLVLGGAYVTSHWSRLQTGRLQATVRERLRGT